MPHTCSVCPQAIPQGRLMCPAHWRLVPKGMQLRVWRTWEAYRSAPAGQGLQPLADYQAAIADAAEHVTSRHLATTPTTTLKESP